MSLQTRSLKTWLPVLKQPGKATIEPDRAAAIQQAIANCQPGDVVLVAGKGHETWQEIGGQKIPFSDETSSGMHWGMRHDPYEPQPGCKFAEMRTVAA